METKKEINGLKNFLDFSKLDFQSVITGFYISIVIIGMIFNYTKYRLYNINIFELSDIADFLITPLGDPFIILLSLLNFLILYLILRGDQWIRKTKPEFYKKFWFGMSEKSWFDSFYKLQWLFVIPLYLFIISDAYATIQKKKLVKKNDNLEIQFTDKTNISGKKIGANSTFHFILQDSATVKIIPTASIKTITKLIRKKKVK